MEYRLNGTILSVLDFGEVRMRNPWIKFLLCLTMPLLLFGAILILLRECDPSTPAIDLLMQATIPFFAIIIVISLVAIYSIHKKIKRTIAEIKAETKSAPPPDPLKDGC